MHCFICDASTLVVYGYINCEFAHSFYSISHFLCSMEIPGDYIGLLRPLVSLPLVSLAACKSIRGEWVGSNWQPVYAAKSVDDQI